MASTIFPTPASVFDGSTDWPAALVTVQQMSSYLRRIYQCQKCNINSKVSKELAVINFILTAIGYDGPDKLNNPADWQDGIETAYRLLYPLT